MRKLLGLVALSLLIAMTATGCGGGGGGNAKKGGSITINSVGPDSYDPVTVLSTQGLEPMHLVYTPLVAFKDVEGPGGNDLVPGLAEALPKISKDGKTYTLKMRAGLKYSDGSPVVASDFAHTVKRMLILGSPFSPFFTGIVGAKEFQSAKNPNGKIPGIVTDDKTGDITIKLTEADSKFQYALGLQDAGLTPAAKSPFKKATPPGLGPYTIKVVSPTRLFYLYKNKRFNIPGMAKGSIDKITVKVSDNINRQAQDIINNRADYMTDDPAGDLLPQVQAKYRDRFRLDPTPANTYFFFMNVRTKPFDNAKVRQAVNYAIDKRALVRIFNGRLKPGCNFLPPGIVGYKKIDPCPWGDPNSPPNTAKAKQLINDSGQKGAPVTVWGNNKDPRPAIANYYTDVLNTIGLKAKTRIIDQQVYFETIGNQKTKAQTGFTDYFEDFPHPDDFFNVNVDGTAIQPTNNFNFGNTNDPDINRKLAELRKVTAVDSVAEKYAALDKELIGKAYIVPYGTELKSTFLSDRMDFQNCSGTHALYLHDWSLFCLK